MVKELNSSSANPQSNGWSFQYAAALIIYLENMNCATCFCVEGTEDIIVNLKNGKIAAQAKCGLEKDSIIAPHLEEIVDSIRTLSQNSDADELISISNFYAPLGRDDAFSSTQFLDKKRFKDLTTNSQTKIRERSKNKGYVIDFTKFKLWFVRFEGEEPDLSIEEYLAKKLRACTFDSVFPISDLMNQWLRIIQLNGRDTKRMIEAEVMCGTLFGKILSNTNIERITKIIGEEIDPCYEEDFRKFFLKYFNQNSQNFRTYCKISADFNDFCNSTKPQASEKYKNFVEYYCNSSNIPDDIKSFFDNYDSRNELSLRLYKLFVAYVCYRRDCIRSIRSAFGYENN